MKIPDNYDAWEVHEREQQQWLESRPVCADCGEHIQNEFAFHINGDWICEECMDSYRQVVPE